MHLRELVALALEEDIGPGDVTTLATVPAGRRGRARIVAKTDLVVAGGSAAHEVFSQLGAAYTALAEDGQAVSSGTVIAHIDGPLSALMMGERVALNFLMRLCGIATHTAAVVQAAPGLKIVDTRKTTPLLRSLERQAVVTGGGGNHRFALYDGVLIKDNHIVAAGGIAAAVASARARAHHLLRIELEVEDLDQVQQGLRAGVDALLLDNMSNELLTRAVALARSWQAAGGQAVLLEASGNMTAQRLPSVAATGVDLVSMGGLIHQATWADLSMKLASVDDPEEAVS